MVRKVRRLLARFPGSCRSSFHLSFAHILLPSHILLHLHFVLIYSSVSDKLTEQASCGIQLAPPSKTTTSLPSSRLLSHTPCSSASADHQGPVPLPSRTPNRRARNGACRRDTQIGDPKDGVLCLQRELQVVNTTALIRNLIGEDAEYGSIYKGAMTCSGWKMYNELKKKQFIYYTNLLND